MKYTIEKEKEMIQKYQQNNSPAIENEVVLFFKKLVFKCVSHYKTHAFYEDLVQEAYIALLYALKSFDCDKNIRFSSYLSCAIGRRVSKYVRRHSLNYTISEASPAYKYFFKLMEIFNDYNDSSEYKKFLEENNLLESDALVVHQGRSINNNYKDVNDNSLMDAGAATVDPLDKIIALSEIDQLAENTLSPSHKKAIKERIQGYPADAEINFNKKASSQLYREAVNRIRYMYDTKIKDGDVPMRRFKK
jgi:RNA polymerase sigma factor (sigma-70 family)